MSSRYQFGELRLSRLNFWVTFCLGHFTYHNVHGYYSAYFARFFGPLLFILAVLSVLLSAIQVALAVGQPLDDRSWSVFAYNCHGFATFAIVCVALVIVFLFSMLIFRFLRETIFALKKSLSEAQSEDDRRQYVKPFYLKSSSFKISFCSVQGVKRIARRQCFWVQLGTIAGASFGAVWHR